MKAKVWRWSIIAIIAGCFALYQAGNWAVHLWDRDEPRYSQASREMLQNRNWIIPKKFGQTRYEKPVLIYWCQAASMSVFGDNVFAARFPSGAAITALLTMLAVLLWRHVGPQRATWTVLVLGTAAMIIASAKMCLTDSVLLLWICIAQVCLYAIWRGSRQWWVAIVLWVAIALGLLTKGPFNIGVLSMTIVALAVIQIERKWGWAVAAALLVAAGLSASDLFRRHLDPTTIRTIAWSAKIIGLLLAGVYLWQVRRLLPPALAWLKGTRPAIGIAVVVLLCGPWLLTAYLREPAYVAAMFKEAEKHATIEMEGHSGPPGWHTVVIWATFYPWSLLIPTALTIGVLHRRLPPIMFALAAIFGPWLFVELWQTKLPHYAMPAYPALALLVGDALVRCIRRQHDDLHRTLFVVGAGIWALITMKLADLPWLAVGFFKPLPIGAMVVLSLMGMAYAATVFLLFQRRRIAAGAVAMAVGMAIVIATFFLWYLPAARFLHISRLAAQTLQAHGAIPAAFYQQNVKDYQDPSLPMMIDYKEDSLPFYAHGAIREQRDNGYLSKADPSDWPAWFVLTSEVWNNTPPQRQALLEIIDRIHGFAYADGGRIVEVLVARKRDTVPATQPAEDSTTAPAGP